MKSIIQKAIYGILGIVGLGLFGLGFMAYFVSSYDKTKGIVYDGLGRPLVWGLISIFGGICTIFHGFCRCIRSRCERTEEAEQS